MTSVKRNGKRHADHAKEKETESSSADANLENYVRLNSLNPYITCPLCDGYFIEATTVIDCLHTFCKSCLLKYFEDNNDCPKCHCQIHQSHPSHYVAFDRTMQDIVYKLVPGMQAEEQQRREQFKKQQAKEGCELNGCMLADGNTTLESSVLLNDASVEAMDVDAIDADSNPTDCCCAGQDPTTSHRRNDEQVLIKLIPHTNLDPINRSFVRLSAYATVNTIKRLLAYLLLSDITKYIEFDIFCNNEFMGRDFSMAFIRKTRWRNKAEPLELIYRKHLEF